MPWTPSHNSSPTPNILCLPMLWSTSVVLSPLFSWHPGRCPLHDPCNTLTPLETQALPPISSVSLCFNQPWWCHLHHLHNVMEAVLFMTLVTHQLPFETQALLPVSCLPASWPTSVMPSPSFLQHHPFHSLPISTSAPSASTHTLPLQAT